MEKEHKKKINEAIKLCETSMQFVLETVEKNTQDKKRAKVIQQFLLQNTFFAGGLFRSIFVDMPVNDIDIFFNNADAAIEFRHICASDLKALFKSDKTLSSQFTYYIKRTKNPDISFITSHGADPLSVMSNFDYSFNQHFFSLKDYEMMFDVSTFYKTGSVISLHGDPVANMNRAMRFMSEGFMLDNFSKARLMEALVSDKKLESDGMILDTFNNRLSMDTSSSGEGKKKAFMHYGRYITADYFNRGNGAALGIVPTLSMAQQAQMQQGQQQGVGVGPQDFVNATNVWNVGTFAEPATATNATLAQPMPRWAAVPTTLGGGGGGVNMAGAAGAVTVPHPRRRGVTDLIIVDDVTDPETEARREAVLRRLQDVAGPLDDNF